MKKIFNLLLTIFLGFSLISFSNKVSAEETTAQLYRSLSQKVDVETIKTINIYGETLEIQGNMAGTVFFDANNSINDYALVITCNTKDSSHYYISNILKSSNIKQIGNRIIGTLIISYDIVEVSTGFTLINDQTATLKMIYE